MRVLISGGASGIGRASAELLGERGHSVGLLDRDEGLLANVLAEFTAAGIDAAGAVADVTDAVVVDRAVSEIAESLGGLDGLVTAAGIGGYTGDVTETEIDAWLRVISISFLGCSSVCRAPVPVNLRQSGVGAIISISSRIRTRRLFSPSHRTSSEGRSRGLTRGNEIDHAKEAIRVNCVCPFVLNPPMLTSSKPSSSPAAEDERARLRMPLARHAQAVEIAATIAFLLSGEASYLTGSIVSVDGGWMAA